MLTSQQVPLVEHQVLTDTYSDMHSIHRFQGPEWRVKT